MATVDDVDWNGIARREVEEATAAEQTSSCPSPARWSTPTQRMSWSRRASTPILSWWVAADTAACCIGCLTVT